MKITMAHGSGGQSSAQLMSEIFGKHFKNHILDRMEDAAVLRVGGETAAGRESLDAGGETAAGGESLDTGRETAAGGESLDTGRPLRGGRIACSTDSFVVTPLEFKGGDIGKLCVCGTVNDLLVSGAEPKYLTAGFILETGVDVAELEKIARSMAETAREAGVLIVAGDTKVVEGKGEIYVNTAGVGFVAEDVDWRGPNCRPGDRIIVSGNLGDHHAAILSRRMGIENDIRSDCAPLSDMVGALHRGGVAVRAARDVTRGGLATVLNELARASGTRFVLEQALLPVSPAVRGLCGLLGLDPLYMGNEGKLAVVVAPEDAEKTVELLRASRYGEDACCIGAVEAAEEPSVVLVTELGGRRVVGPLFGEGLPRIC